MEWTLAGVVRTHGRAEGVGSQDRVAFLDENGTEHFEILFGGGKVNAVNVAVNWRLAPGEMEYTIKRQLREPYWKGQERRIH